ncbi:MAG: hypothetical protein LBB54_05865, partial [Cellulomonadaceae bacterium]|nr:hypothetical protein [Cellulomonadaceae bacterium]
MRIDPASPYDIASDPSVLDDAAAEITVTRGGSDPLRVELPVVRPTEGVDGIAVASLLRQTGMVTYDPGFM